MSHMHVLPDTPEPEGGLRTDVERPPLREALAIAVQSTILNLQAHYCDWRMGRSDLAQQRHLRTLRRVHERGRRLSERLEAHR